MPKVTKFHFNQSQSENRQKYKVQSVMSFPHVLRRSKAHGEHLPRYKSQHCFITIIKRVLFLLVVLLTLFQVTGNNPEEAIVKVAEGNRLDET
jgi:hypothetical protein